jgi:thioesterase domain-containing protein
VDLVEHKGIEGRVHSGFSQLLGALENALLALKSELKAVSATEVCITGHSLGGALATLAAARLASQGEHTIKVCC